jgi:bifunctional UDP-N-acetylglucosamine pyrophosphorylase/glucosamine-1-phosphate N-acetyltransferase
MLTPHKAATSEQKSLSQTSAAAGIILAAGKGTRMKSDLPKVLHRVCGLPLGDWVGRAMISAGISKPVMVIGHGGELLQDALGDKYEYVWQRDQLGTGHAALQAAELMAGCKGPVVIAPGDTPLISAEVIARLIEHHRKTGATCTVATAFLNNPTGYGRIMRDGTGSISRIVEQKDATVDEQTIMEVNSGIYVFDGAVLFGILPTLGNQNSQGEYYLTDALAAAGKSGKIESLAFEDTGLLMGVNDRWQLAEADKLMRQSILKRHALSGVTLQDPDSTYIEADVQLGRDCHVFANTHLMGSTKIGEGCKIGPNSLLRDSTVGNECVVLMSHLYQAKLGNKVKVGPFANIRPGAVLGDNSKIGNFVEIKNAQLGQFVAASHLTYIGDASIGDGSNIGAGTITCNYDGYEKHRTEIGARVFVGSNSTLIAPRQIGDDAFIAAGSTIDQDVPPGALALARTRQEVKEGWVQRWRKRKSSSTEKGGKTQ